MHNPEEPKIYCITNKLNGKRYIGQTTKKISSRWGRHCGNPAHRSYINNAIKKYGKENFIFQIWEKDNIVNHDHLCAREQFWIKSLNTKAPNGYNLTDGGEGAYGRKMSAKHKEIMRNVHTGKITTDETRKKMSAAKKGHTYWVGKKHSEETRQKMSIRMKLQWEQGVFKKTGGKNNA